MSGRAVFSGAELLKMYFLYFIIILITLKNYSIQSVLKVLERRGKLKLDFRSRSNYLNMSESWITFTVPVGRYEATWGLHLTLATAAATLLPAWKCLCHGLQTTSTKASGLLWSDLNVFGSIAQEFGSHSTLGKASNQYAIFQNLLVTFLAIII